MSTDRLQVLLATPDFPPDQGGIHTLLRNLVDHRERVDYRVLTPRTRTGSIDDGGLDVVRVGRPGLPYHASLALLNAATVREARRWSPDVVLAGHIVTAPGALATGRPTVIYTYAKEISARAALVRRCSQRAGSTIVISGYTRELALAAGARADRLRLILPGVRAAAPPAVPPANAPDPLVLVVARLEDRYKGFDVLLRSLPLVRSRVPDAHLAIVGDGRLRAPLEALARALGLGPAVTFAGACTDAERDAWMARAAVFAMPSRRPAGGGGGEGFGLVLLEASAHGLPVVAGGEGGALDAVDADRSGLLVDPRDHVALADALVDLLSDPTHRAAMGQAGRKWAAGLGWDRMAREVERVLHEAAGRG